MAYPRPLLLACSLVALLAAVPLLFIIGYTIDVGWSETWRLLVRPRVGDLLVNTTELVVGGMLASAVLGTAAAWLVERTDLPLRRVWHVLLAAPLAVPAFVVSYGWVSLTPAVEGYRGALLIVVLAYYPLVYLPVGATLRGLDPALEESARSLGLGSWRTFARVVLPQLRPAILGGSLLVGLHLLAEFGALQMLRFPTFTTAIYDQYRSSFNGPAANMLAGVLVLYCGVLVVTELSLRGRHRYARLGSGVSRTAEPARLGWLTVPAVAGLGAVVALALGVPLASVVRWLLVGASTAFPVGDLATATATAAGLGLAGALATVALASPVAWLAVRHPGRIATLLERSTYTANALPGIVVALTLVTLSLRVLPAVYQTTTLLIIAYAIMFLPRAMVAARAAIAQAPPVLDDVALALGNSPMRAWRRVTLPLIAPGIGAGAILVFLAVVTELTATLLLSPTGTETLATQFWSETNDIDYGAAAPYAALMVALSTPATLLLTRSVRRGP
ncbi:MULTISPECIES: iron ABC transporter permease [unclassified Pseudofrankia]|uniref:ABC transporter permease n=1 Tax=unclassified Pseudofrankia TaxID=2994372 RepID=UPI0008DABEF4|nr:MULTISPECIES: iron ABC transporter permease [unclassified Pseudofrankia]MDT3444517.1 iron ABC transporter permease [Pseudofrankia sp. BMG5.37]OHV56395.1 iron ABC transporter permease [Pseudofrankia sp. BMG5.36]